VLAAACSGVVLDHQLAIPWRIWAAAVPLALGVWAWAFRRQAAAVAALPLLAAVAALAGLWHHERWWWFRPDEIARYATDAAQPVLVRVIALEPPRWSPAEPPSPLSTVEHDEQSRCTVRVEALRQADQWVRVSGRVSLLVRGRLADVRRGDRLEVAGLLVRVRSPGNPGEPDLAAQRRGQRQLAVLHCRYGACVQRLASGAAWSPLRQLGHVRVWGEQMLERHVALRQSELAAALLLGSREQLPRATTQAFFTSGTSHLLAISGLHVSILATALWVWLRLEWSPRRRLGLFALTATIAVVYAVLVGARAPVVRAAVMIGLYCLARAGGRRPAAWNAWAAAALVTVGLTPSGIYDLGTQLSFLAVAVLIARWPAVTARGRRQDPLQKLVEQAAPAGWRLARAAAGRLADLMWMSTLVWLVTLPLVAHRLHIVPWLGVPMNVVLGGPVSVALFAAAAVLVLAPVPALAAVAGWLCGGALHFMQWCTAIVGTHPWACSWVAGPPVVLVALFYGALALTHFTPLRPPRRWAAGLLALWLGLCAATSGTAIRAWRLTHGAPLRVSFVAAGHGLCVLIELPNGRSLLYDAGRMGSPRVAAAPIAAALWSRRIAHLDAIIVSHADADHFNAVPELLHRFSVGVVYVSPVMFRAAPPALQELAAAVRGAQVPLEMLREGDGLDGGEGVCVRTLHPAESTDAGGDNSDSIVLWIGRGEHGLLLTGDLEGRGLAELLAELPPPCDVLLAPHHGSALSRPRDVVAWAHPRWVVISAGAKPSTASMLQPYARGGAVVHWTHRDGLVEAVIGEGPWRIRTHRHGPSPAAAGHSARVP
jgi:competence protein ComEC